MIPKKIPTIIGIFLTIFLVLVLAFTMSQLEKVTSLFSRADQGHSLTNPVGIANITDTGFTVYWTTDQETSGSISWGKTKDLSEGVAVDDRGSGKYLTHFVRVVGLTPQTKYHFKIILDTSFYEITTEPKATGAKIVDPIFGKVLDSSGEPAVGVIAVWEAGGGKIAALSKVDGTFVLPVNSAPSEVISLEAGLLGKSVINCKPGSDQPLPTVKLGQNINCGLSVVPKTGPPGTQLKINTLEGETVSSTLPTFSGKANANQVIKIEVHSSTVYSGTIKADPDGSWSWTPPANLSPGQHTVTLSITNPDGTIQTITRNFAVNTGEQILPITLGTPSATLPPPEATPSPMPVPVPVPIPVPTPPQTGVVENTLVLLTLGTLFATLGATLWNQLQKS